MPFPLARITFANTHAVAPSTVIGCDASCSRTRM
jgi:hypothetical protein